MGDRFHEILITVKKYLKKNRESLISMCVCIYVYNEREIEIDITQIYTIN